MASSDVASRIEELRRLVEHHNYRYHVLDDPELPDTRVRRALRRAEGARGGASRARHAGLADPAGRRARRPRGSRRSRTSSAMGSLEKVTTDEALEKWADDVRKRLDTDEPVAYVVEPKIDGSAISLVYENGVLRPRRDARRRLARGGRDREPPHRLGSVPLRIRADGDAPALLEVRGEVYFPLCGFARFNEAQAAAGKKQAPNPRNAAAGSLRQLNPAITARAAALPLGLRDRRRARGELPDTQRETLDWLREHGFRTNPHAERVETIEEVAAACAAWEARRATLDYEIDGVVIKVDDARPAAPPRRAPRAAALGAGLQVGAVDGDHDAPQDPHPRRSHRGAQPVGRARARPGRRRHGLERDAPQRGGHQPQGHPRGRPRDRPAGRRRDPAGRRARPASTRRDREFRMPAKCPLCGVDVVKPEGEVMHRCPNRACPSRGLETLIHWVSARHGHRGRRRAVRPQALGRGAAPLDARPLPADGRAAARSSTATARSPPARASTSIEASKAQPFSRVLFGLNIPKIGWVLARNLARHFGLDRRADRRRARRSSSRRRGSGPTAPSSSPSGSPRTRT